MADPPPKKVGSLRDRIAQFENKGPAPTPAAAPAPRPKPSGHVSWKPRPTSPPQVTSDDDAEKEKKAAAGMSAADAKASIGAGGSLKERMAALQGRGGFGAPPPVTPKPALEKPKWKPPPVVSPPADDSDGEGKEATPRAFSPPVLSPPVSDAPAPSDDQPAAEAEEPKEESNEEPKEDDPEEEERQRRAAIAARMARLGGARVGMGPPIFGRKPDVPKKPETLKPEGPKDETKAESGADTQTEAVKEKTVQSPPADEGQPSEKTSEEYFAQPNASSTSLLSADSTPSSAPRSPAMPVPAAPKRAAPPRRKAPKSPSPAPPPPAAEQLVEDAAHVVQSPAAGTPQLTSDDSSKELQEAVHKSKDDEVALGLEPAEKTLHAPEPPRADEARAAPEREEAEPAREAQDNIDELALDNEHERGQDEVPKTASEAAHAQEAVEEHEPSAVPAPTEEPTEAEDTLAVEEPEHAEEEAAEAEEEEDENARRKRIADRLRQQGGFNPFSAPPPMPTRKATADVPKSPIEDHAGAQEDVDVLPEAVDVARRESVDLSAPSMTSLASPPPVPPATTRPTSDRRTSVPAAPAEHHTHDDQDAGQDEHEVDDDSRNVANESELAYGREDDEQGLAYHDQDDDERSVYDEPQAEPSVQSPSRKATRELQEVEAPPRPPRRISVPPPQPVAEALEDEPAPPPPPRRSMSIPRPPRTAAVEPSASAPPAVHSAAVDSAEADEELAYKSPSMRPSRRSLPPPPLPLDQARNATPEPAPSPKSPRRSLPPPPRHMEAPIYEEPSSAPSPPPSASRPVTQMFYDEHDDAADDRSEYADEHEEPRAASPPHRRLSMQSLRSIRSIGSGSVRSVQAIARRVSGTHVTSPTEQQRQPSLAVPKQDAASSLDDSDGDPIDPSFYSPQKSPLSPPVPLADPSPEEEQDETQGEAHEEAHEEVHEEEPEAPPMSPEDEESARRRTIAERMAKLGGVRFGAPPPMTRPPPPPAARSPPADDEAEEHEEEHEDAPAQEQPAEEEEDEAARKQRIAARLAASGGMRFGMLPTPAAPPPRPKVQQEEDSETPPPPPPSRRPPPRGAPPVPNASLSSQEVPPPRPSSRPPPPRAAPPPPVPQHEQSDAESEASGVKVEAEESEIEEVEHPEPEEEAPPPPPPVRRASRPPVPTGRPPVPPPQSRPTLSPTASAANDFVMVETPEEMPPVPPPRTVSLKRAPPSSAPPPPPPEVPSASRPSQQWEQTVDFGGEQDLSLSSQWGEDSTQYPVPSRQTSRQTSSSDAPPPPPPKSTGPPQATLSADDLMAHWGRVGVQIAEVATTLYEKSRKSLIGDGTHLGFVNAVLNEVPNAARPAPPYDAFGYLIYEQSGAAVHKRASEILPGDVVTLHEAKLKGHKGLQIYHQNVGIGEPLVAIIGDFEFKKTKVKVFQANQHVGQESVESVSYRLEDLKSGTVRIYRVLEA